MQTYRRFTLIIIAAIFLSVTTKVWAATAEPLAAPVIAPLSTEAPERVSTKLRVRPGTLRASKEGRLATMAALIVFAFLIAGLTSSKGESHG